MKNRNQPIAGSRFFQWKNGGIYGGSATVAGTVECNDIGYWRILLQGERSERCHVRSFFVDVLHAFIKDEIRDVNCGKGPGVSSPGLIMKGVKKCAEFRLTVPTYTTCDRRERSDREYLD